MKLGLVGVFVAWLALLGICPWQPAMGPVEAGVIYAGEVFNVTCDGQGGHKPFQCKPTRLQAPDYEGKICAAYCTDAECCVSTQTCAEAGAGLCTTAGLSLRSDAAVHACWNATCSEAECCFADPATQRCNSDVCFQKGLEAAYDYWYIGGDGYGSNGYEYASKPCSGTPCHWSSCCRSARMCSRTPGYTGVLYNGTDAPCPGDRPFFDSMRHCRGTDYASCHYDDCCTDVRPTCMGLSGASSSCFGSSCRYFIHRQQPWDTYAFPCNSTSVHLMGCQAMTECMVEREKCETDFWAGRYTNPCNAGFAPITGVFTMGGQTEDQPVCEYGACRHEECCERVPSSFSSPSASPTGDGSGGGNDVSASPSGAPPTPATSGAARVIVGIDSRLLLALLASVLAVYDRGL